MILLCTFIKTGIKKTHQAGCTSEVSDGPRHGAERVYAVFQLSTAHKAECPLNKNPCQPFCNETGAACDANSHDANSRLCNEFHARMKRVNSKCLSVQLHANSTIYSHLV